LLLDFMDAKIALNGLLTVLKFSPVFNKFSFQSMINVYIEFLFSVL